MGLSSKQIKATNASRCMKEASKGLSQRKIERSKQKDASQKYSKGIKHGKESKRKQIPFYLHHSLQISKGSTIIYHVIVSLLIRYQSEYYYIIDLILQSWKPIEAQGHMTSTQQNYSVGPAVLGLQATHLATVCGKQLETEGKQHQGDKTPAFIFCLVKCTQPKPLTTKVIYIYIYINIYK